MPHRRPRPSISGFLLLLALAAGQRLVIAVPAGCWKALRLHPGATHALMANALSPE